MHPGSHVYTKARADNPAAKLVKLIYSDKMKMQTKFMWAVYLL